MALRKFMERITKPVDELDREELTTWCNSSGCVPINEAELRKPVCVSGEVRSVRIVPRAGADALEAAVYDGRGSLIAVFLGRRKIPGISPGRRLQLEGVVSRADGVKVMYNPLYTLF